MSSVPSLRSVAAQSRAATQRHEAAGREPARPGAFSLPEILRDSPARPAARPMAAVARAERSVLRAVENTVRDNNRPAPEKPRARTDDPRRAERPNDGPRRPERRSAARDTDAADRKDDPGPGRSETAAADRSGTEVAEQAAAEAMAGAEETGGLAPGQAGIGLSLLALVASEGEAGAAAAPGPAREIKAAGEAGRGSRMREAAGGLADATAGEADLPADEPAAPASAPQAAAAIAGKSDGSGLRAGETRDAATGGLAAADKAPGAGGPTPRPAFLDLLPQAAANEHKAAAVAHRAIVTDVAVGRVPIEIGLKAIEGTNRFEIRLAPDELGRVDVRLDIEEGGEVRAHLVVERPEALALLTRERAQLEHALEQAGLKPPAEGIAFSLRDGAAENGGRGGQGGEAGRETSPEPPTQPEEAAAAPVPRAVLSRLGALDLRI